MSNLPDNYVRLHGTASVRKTFPANGEKQAMAFGSIRAEGKEIDVKAFGAPAEALGNAEGTTVTAIGKVSFSKPKDWKKGDKTPWPMCIVVEEVEEHEPRAPGKKTAADDDDLPF